MRDRAAADGTGAVFEPAPGRAASFTAHSWDGICPCRIHNGSASITAIALERGEHAAVNPAIRPDTSVRFPKAQLIATGGIARRVAGKPIDPGTQLWALVQQGVDSGRMLHLDALLTRQ
ncbi:hypothetical protein IFM12275_63430 [Nocardia sputorum]|nr:hypothetical protein IFM12275_63430 [Nocardia sputorum]